MQIHVALGVYRKENAGEKFRLLPGVQGPSNLQSSPPEFTSVGLPEYVGVAQPVHELHLAQHVGFIAGQRVHLQRHHLAGDAVLHLEREARISSLSKTRSQRFCDRSYFYFLHRKRIQYIK